jgi:hypothetical protein
MGLDDLKNKAKDIIGQHPDQANQGIDKAREFADEKTGGKHSDQIQQGADKLKQAVGGNQDGGGQDDGQQQNNQ